MSIILCEGHNRRWDSDRLSMCPLCENENSGPGARLLEPARIGNTIFNAGTGERSVIERAQREYRYHLMLEQPSTDTAVWSGSDRRKGSHVNPSHIRTLQKYAEGQVLYKTDDPPCDASGSGYSSAYSLGVDDGYRSLARQVLEWIKESE